MLVQKHPVKTSVPSVRSVSAAWLALLLAGAAAALPVAAGAGAPQVRGGDGNPAALSDPRKSGFVPGVRMPETPSVMWQFTNEPRLRDGRNYTPHLTDP